MGCWRRRSCGSWGGGRCRSGRYRRCRCSCRCRSRSRSSGSGRRSCAVAVAVGATVGVGVELDGRSSVMVVAVAAPPRKGSPYTCSIVRRTPEMIVGRGDSCGSQPWRGGRGIDMSTAICVGRSLIESNDKKRMSPVRAGGHQRHERLKKSVALSGRAVVHVVGQIRDYERKVHGRIKTRQMLNVGALRRIQSNAFKADRRIVFPRTCARQPQDHRRRPGRLAVKATAGIVLSIDAP